jgi:hypothetical protein
MPRIRLLPAVAALAALVAATSCSSGSEPPPAKSAPAASVPAKPGDAAAKGRGLPDLPEVPKPAFTEVVVPGGTSFDVALETPLASNRSRIEDPVRTRVVADVMVRGKLAIPQGTELTGTVLQATPSGRGSGAAALAFRLLDLHAGTTPVRIRVDRVSRDAAAPGAEVTLPAGTTFHLSLDDAIRVQVAAQ